MSQPAAPSPPAAETPPKDDKKPTEPPKDERPMEPRALTSSANLFRLLPTGAVLAFQTLAATFTNQGQCLPANWWLTLWLVTFLSAICVFFSFTDTIVYKDKAYHGVALPRTLHVFNMPKQEQREIVEELRRRRMRPEDWVHAFFTAVVFLTIAGSDVGLQKCFFPDATEDTRQLLRNLPLGMAVLSSFVFMVFPTKRQGMRFIDNDYNVLPEPKEEEAGDKASQEEAKTKKDEALSRMAKVLPSSANLLQLLPSGAVLAFQTLAATFTNQGQCLPSNWWLTLGLVTFLTSTCIFFSFTDSVVYKEKTYHGVALPGRLHLFDLPKKEQDYKLKVELMKRGLKPDDWVHAIFTAVVFLSIAGSDVGLQDCFFPDATQDTEQLLRNLPLGMAVLSSFVFMIFPTKRNGIGFDDSNYTVMSIPTPKKDQEGSASAQTQQSSVATASGSMLRSSSCNKVTPTDQPVELHIPIDQ
ncbi:hypothetical protein ACP4OV_001314 [Aristida adscensionis]